ncbi:MAG: decaprenyl-phosphate phosphoribosyltransferase [Alphaproteobacteria bacterium]
MALPPALALLRPHQWVKNGLVAAPLFFTPEILGLQSIISVAITIAAFCAISSSVYILNDYKDREADRAHPEKKNRPFAAGTVSPQTGFGLFGILVAGAITALYLLQPQVLPFVGAYWLMNVAYSYGLKKISLLDVMIIALGFIIRVEAGAASIEVDPSVWIIIMTGLGALFIALAKRRDDVVNSYASEHRKSLDGYTAQFLDTAIGIIIAALLVAYMIYTTDKDVMMRMGSTKLYYTAPFVVLGLLRYLQITIVEERSGSPTSVIMRDKVLLVVGALWALTFGILIYL